MYPKNVISYGKKVIQSKIMLSPKKIASLTTAKKGKRNSTYGYLSTFSKKTSCYTT
jgi:hypothetical protein